MLLLLSLMSGARRSEGATGCHTQSYATSSSTVGYMCKVGT